MKKRSLEDKLTILWILLMCIVTLFVVPAGGAYLLNKLFSINMVIGICTTSIFYYGGILGFILWNVKREK